MAILQATDLNDLIATTQRWLGKPKFTQIAMPLQRYTAMSELMQKSKLKITGKGVEWRVMVNHAQSASNVGLGAPDNLANLDTMVTASADWRNCVASYQFIHQEMDMNMGEEEIVDLMQERRMAAMLALVELMENNFWGVPVTADDTVTPWGFNTWFTKNATEGFNGGAPSGYTTIGLNPSTYTRWKHWTAQYTSVSEDDLFAKWNSAADHANFIPPVKNPNFNAGDRWAFYTNYSVKTALDRQLRQQNDNLGRDIARFEGDGVFRGIPYEWVPRLDADTTNPVIGINWGLFKTFVLNRWWLKETNVPIYPGYHTTSAHFLDCTYQHVVMDRRQGGSVIATGTSYTG